MNTIELTHLFETLDLHSTLEFEGLGVAPITLREMPVFRPDYLNLDEAISLKTLAVEEISDAGRVPEIRVRNLGGKPVLVLDGEEFVGAKQNRIANATIMVPPQSDFVIPVSCVEQGRWRHSCPGFQSSEWMLFREARAKKSAQVTESLRRCGSRTSDQSEIWSDVNFKLASMDAHSPTDDMTDAYTHSAPRLRDYEKTFPARKDQVGALFRLQGRQVGLELFGAPETFGQAYRKILRSYAMDAVAGYREEIGSDAGLSNNDWLESISMAISEPYPSVGMGTELRLSSDSVSGAALVVSGQLVHLCAFRVEQKT